MTAAFWRPTQRWWWVTEVFSSCLESHPGTGQINSDQMFTYYRANRQQDSTHPQTVIWPALRLLSGLDNDVIVAGVNWTCWRLAVSSWQTTIKLFKGHVTVINDSKDTPTSYTCATNMINIWTNCRPGAMLVLPRKLLLSSLLLMVGSRTSILAAPQTPLIHCCYPPR